MTNLAFGVHFGFSPPTHLACLAHVEYKFFRITTQWTSAGKFSLISLFFSRWYSIAPGL